MYLKPTADRVAVLLDPEHSTCTPHGVIEIPEDLQHFAVVGTVIAVGPQARDVAVGDRVILNVRAPRVEIPTGKGLVVLVKETKPTDEEHDAILAVIENGVHVDF